MPSQIRSTPVSGRHQLTRSGASSRRAPMSLVNIELHRAFVAHLQQERLAVVLMLDVDALHDFEGFQRLFAQRNQNLFSISHESSLGAPCSSLGDGTRG